MAMAAEFSINSFWAWSAGVPNSCMHEMGAGGDDGGCCGAPKVGWAVCSAPGALGVPASPAALPWSDSAVPGTSISCCVTDAAAGGGRIAPEGAAAVGGAPLSTAGLEAPSALRAPSLGPELGQLGPTALDGVLGVAHAVDVDVAVVVRAGAMCARAWAAPSGTWCARPCCSPLPGRDENSLSSCSPPCGSVDASARAIDLFCSTASIGRELGPRPAMSTS